MANKPSIICTLVKNKFIGGQRGFVDTFNWIASWVSSVKGEKADTSDPDKLRIKIEKSEQGKPVLKIVGEAGMKLKSGDDSNVVISDERDADGYYKIDVYYK